LAVLVRVCVVVCHYVLIDFENVLPEQLDALADESFRVLVFVGANQAKVPFEVAQSLQRMGDRAEYVKIAGSGRNALDFHIAYYIGRLAATSPAARFTIISKDTGFDPLLRHLASKGVIATRCPDLGHVPGLAPTSDVSPEERLGLFATRLQELRANRPRTVKSLSNMIQCFFRHGLTPDGIAALVHELESSRVITISDGKVSYPPRAAEAADPVSDAGTAT
jgi:hypothetical protein